MKKCIAVIGNGFDLHCGLKSSYDDFFRWRVKRLFPEYADCSNIEDQLETATNGARDIDYFEANKEVWPEDFTRWDYIFLLAQADLENKETKQWQNIENIIYNVVSIVLWPEKTKRQFDSNLEFKKSNSDDNKHHDHFVTWVKKLSGANNDSLEKKANNLLRGLKQFEKIFAEYIIQEREKHIYHGDYGNRDHYADLARSLLESLVWDRPCGVNAQVDVLSFNYTLDPTFIDYIKFDNHKSDMINSWTNIHGVAAYANKGTEWYVNEVQNSKFEELVAPIFGIDNRDILNDDFDNDLRLLFSKPYRLVDSNVISRLSEDICVNADTIIIYGHSLGRADYSYFETLFDNANLYHSKTKLEFFYHVGNDPMHDRERYTSAVFRLLTSYGQTLSTSHGENIINKLVLERRLAVIPDKNNHLSNKPL